MIKRTASLRRLSRRCARRLNRPCRRGLTRQLGNGRRVNHLGQALRAIRRATRAHLHLIKLAPERFDFGERDRLAREREAEVRQDVERSVALAQAYGVSEAEAAAKMHQARENRRGTNGAETVQFARRKAGAIERWCCEWEVWLDLGRECLARHRRLRPHQPLSLGTIARLLELASLLGRLSTGLRPFFSGGVEAVIVS